MRFTSEGLCLEEFTTNESYAEVLFKRATGALPEMETSKALAKLLKSRVKESDIVCDVGCGAGHFLRSFLREWDVPFSYMGIEYTPLFLHKALEAWKHQPQASFKQGSVFDIPREDQSSDITVCSNVLTHMPTIVKPVEELIRITKRTLVIRSTLGDRSYRIQQVFNRSFWPYTHVDVKDEFEDDGTPRSFSYENIHSKGYFESVVKRFAPSARVEFIADDQFDPARINQDAGAGDRPISTKVVGGQEVYGYLLLPHTFAVIDLRP